MAGHALVEILPPEDKTAAGLFIPDSAQSSLQGERQKPFKCLVLGMGAWKKTKQGFSVLPDFGIGHRVICSPYSGQKLSHNISDRLLLVRFDDVLALIQSTT